MSKYIDADKAFETITDFAGRAETKGIYAAFWKSAKAVKKMPAADVEPVVHAHWLISEHEFFDCSACGESYYTGAGSKAQAESYLSNGNFYKHCPSCGAVMDGKDDSNETN